MNKNKIIPIVLFCTTVVICGWFGRLIDVRIEQSGTQTLGTLIWLLSPFIVATGLRLIQKNKFATPTSTDNFFHNLLISLLFYPLIIGLTLGVASLSKNYTLQSFAFKPEILVAIVISALVKNLFEEFAWRGYLTPKLDQVGLSRSYNHLITGVIWGLWHLPYFLMLNPSLVINSQTGYIVYCLQFLISVLAVSWIYGELRLRTGTIWYGYILHVLVNIITGTIITFEILKIRNGATALVFNPFDGLIYSVLVTLVIICIQRYFKNRDIKLTKVLDINK